VWLLEPVVDLIVEVILIKVFYWPGWAVLRCFTLGHYPPANPESIHNKGFVAVIGLLACLLPCVPLLVA
jgi:hypothetical protein